MSVHHQASIVKPFGIFVEFSCISKKTVPLRVCPHGSLALKKEILILEVCSTLQPDWYYFYFFLSMILLLHMIHVSSTQL